MKAALLVLGLLILSTSGFAQTYPGIYKGHSILKSSDADSVCRLLTNDINSTAKVVEYERVDKANCFYKIKKNQIKLKCNENPAWTDSIISSLDEKAIISFIKCGV